MKTRHLISLSAFAVMAASISAAGPARHPSFEPIEIPATTSQNRFLNAKTTASGQWSDRAPSLAVNGNRDRNDHWACENLPVWHQIDLGEPQSIAAIRAWPYWGDGRIYQFQIEGSVDGNAWKLLGDMSANSIASDADGHLFRFDPTEVRFVRTTFVGNSRGNGIGGHLVQIEGYAQSPDAGLGGGIGSIDERYPPHGPIDHLTPPSHGISLHGWRGERASAQVVITSDAPHAKVRFDPITLIHSDSKDPIAGSARFVRYTLADRIPRGDILDHTPEMDLPAGANRPAWLEINIPRETKPGIYQGTWTVRSNTSTLDFPIRLEVLPATLPPPADWTIHLDLWQHPDAVARWHDVPTWSDEHLALLKPSMIRLAEAGQKTITTTLIHEPWGAQTYDWYPSMITWIKRADGSWKYDYSIFDRWVSFMSDECGLAHARIHGYSMIPWSLQFRYFDEKQQTWIDARLEPGTDDYDNFWGTFLADFQNHLQTRGWLERMRIAVDERPDRLMRGALATLSRHAPKLRVASAINHPSSLVRELDDLSPIIQHTGNFTRQLLDERRKEGRKTTFYVCTSPPVPNSFTFSPPAESEWLPLFAAAQGFDGFLRWAYHSWVENPLVSTDFTSWPSGDCFLVYPGDRSSIRFERLRDGIESFEKIHLLRNAAGTRSDKACQDAMAALEAALKDFTWDRGRHSGPHAGDVQRANAAILHAGRIIQP